MLSNEIKILKDHKFILLGNEHYNPLGLIRTIGEYGIPVIAIIVRSDYPYASKSKYINNLFIVNNLNDGLELLLRKYGEEQNKPFVFSCDDTTTDFLNINYHILKDKFYFFNSGEERLVNKYMNKYEQTKLAKSVGMKILWTKEVADKKIPDEISYPVITKAVDSRQAGWKNLSFICHNEKELMEAFSKIDSDKIVLQQYVDKKNELGIDGFTIDNGQKILISMAYNYKYIQEGSFSHYMNIFTPTDKAIIDSISRYLSSLHYDGIFDIEFLEDKNGDYYFCEINLRNSGWSYASTRVGMPLPILWALSKVNNEINYQYKIKIADNYSAMEGFDYLRGRKKRNQSWREYIEHFFEADCHFIYNSKDLAPFIAYIVAIFNRKIKKVKN